jgi:phosphatidylglycerophosphatase A
MQRVAYLIATVLGLGDRLPAPGTTAGSLPAIVGWWLAAVVLPDPASRLAATISGAVVAVAVGVWAAAAEARRRGGADPGPVVIDEVAGQWLAVLPAPLLLADQSAATLGLAAVAAFVFFRLFDIAKPWPVNALEKLPGGLGIMADDVAAAGYAAVLLAGALWVL